MTRALPNNHNERKVLTERYSMKRSAVFVLLQFLALLSLSCTRDLPEAGEEKGAAGGREIKVVFSLPGDDFAEGEDLEMRDAVAAAVTAGGHGEVTAMESGMGFMEITVRLKGEGGIGAIKKILFELCPGTRYRIER